MKQIVRLYDVKVFSKDSDKFSVWTLGVPFDAVKRHILRKRKEWGSIRFYISVHN